METGYAAMTKTILLLLILLLAGFVAFIPHIGYAYPLHVDEWMHLTYAKTITQTSTISFPNPFTPPSFEYDVNI
jgi:hypothetical protein